MARQARHRGNRPPEDLAAYVGCPEDGRIGFEPLAVGWLRRDTPFNTGVVSRTALKLLLPFCHPTLTVCRTPGFHVCPLCGERVVVNWGEDTFQLGGAEMRIIGDEDIYAAPDLLYHYVSNHAYQPPAPFRKALTGGVPAGSPEHLALLRALQ